ncbi:MAG: hypothetical protein ACKVS8_11885 [Phycisphaerales bacterium]
MTRPLLALLSLALCMPLLALAPEPDAVPRRWELDVTFGPLRVGTVDLEGQGPRPFYYLTYKAANASASDLLLAPSFDLADGSGKVFRSGRDVPAAATAALIERQQNPSLRDQIAVLGPILQGPEHAREGLVAWPAESLKPDSLTVYAAGFSGESALITPPGDADGTPASPTILRKTRMIRYDKVGDLTGRGDAPIPVAETRWIMR